MRPLTLLAGLLLATAAIACDKSSTAPTAPTSIAGSWTLTKLNGSSLPYAYGPTEDLTAEVYTLAASGSFTQVLTFHATDTGQTSTINAAGNYWLDGTRVSLQDLNSALISFGSWKGDTITLTSGLWTLILARQ